MKKWSVYIFPLILVLIFLKVYPYIFDEKIDLNGDNLNYYLIAKSVAEGHGFSWIMNKNVDPANYPSGYVFFLSFFMLFTQNVIFLKILNGILLLATSVLLFFVVKKLSSNTPFAFIVSVFLLVHSNVLRFSTIMMSEMLYMFISIVTLYFLSVMEHKSPPWKNKYFYFTVVLSAYAYYVRPQGVALIGGILFLYFFTWNWKYLISSALGFVLLIIPWKIRDHMVGFSGSFHAEGILAKNSFRPEEGRATLNDFIQRVADNYESYVSNQIPGSVFHYLKMKSATAEPQIWNWIAGMLIIGLIVYGIIKFPKLKLFFTGYLLANLGALSIIPYGVASNGRYFITFIPVMLLGFFWGLYNVVLLLIKTESGFTKILPYGFLLFLIPVSKGIETDHLTAKSKFYPNYQAYFDIAKVVKEKTDKNVVVCCRKPSLFYFYAERPVVNYIYTSDDKELIRGLIESEVDYVVLDQLGYSSTGLYLAPAIKNNPNLFTLAVRMGNPESYLFQFNKEKAKQLLNTEG